MNFRDLTAKLLLVNLKPIIINKSRLKASNSLNIILICIT